MLKKILAVSWLLAAILGIWKGNALADQVKIGRNGGVLASNQINQIIERGVEGFMVIDVRNRFDFDEGHIKGAKNYSLNDITAQGVSFVAGKSYVVTGDDSKEISDVVDFLKGEGATVFVHQGGMEDWAESGLPLSLN